ncbi:MAG TPA: lipid droplet-associated protein [Actinophytocola sp.]|uniref:lipid droplet-associated protein n=1 Tax=Actinophytocola sp. TaxID=1872138 RepID=UPI002DB8B154|nr:lipid droplet-associated protein [Actinophytocola sp.]HEU5472066.1 lipid droplet-associated protein [Actinophytocola sp.]
MRSLPLPLRVAAGIAATAVEQARDLPAKIVGLPVTVASQALQVSMRVQQHVTELAIKGDEVLAALRPVEETPEWATFDEDLPEDRDPAPFDRVPEDWSDPVGNGQVDDGYGESGPPEDDAADADTDEDGLDPWTLEERALAEETAAEVPPETPDAEPETQQPQGVPNYDELSLPQLRARLRSFTVDELAALLEHERANANRPAFVGMLTRRIATVRDNQ